MIWGKQLATATKVCAIAGAVAAITTLGACAAPQATSTTTPANNPTLPPVTANAPQSVPQNVIVRPAPPKENEYVITAANLNDFQLGDPIVVYFKEPSGLERVAAVMQVVETNPDNRVALVIFRNATVDFAQIGTLSALRIDKQISLLSLERLVPVDSTFVGFTLKDNTRIRIRPEAGLKNGDRLEARRLSSGGNTEALDAPVIFVLQRIEEGGNTALVQLEGTAAWPVEGTLLILSRDQSEHVVPVDNYVSGAKSSICVQSGDQIEVRADGVMHVGKWIGDAGPDGKSRLDKLPIPIDPEYNIVKQYPHAVLMYRIEEPGKVLDGDKGWLAYDSKKTFTASVTGCLAFNINDTNKADNTGSYSVTVIVKP